MRVAVVAGWLLFGCGSGSSDIVDADKPAAPITRLDLPRMDESARVLVLANAKPAAIVWVGSTGGIAIGKTGAAWRGEITPPGRSDVAIEDVRKRVLEAIVDGGGPRADEAQRAFLRLDMDRELAMRQAMARLGTRDLYGGSPDPLVPSPGRLPAADVTQLAKVDRLAPLIVATPSAPATSVASVLHETGGVLAVDHLGKLAAYDLAFERERDRGPTGKGSWLEVSVDATGVRLVVQPEGKDMLVGWTGAVIDRDTLAIVYRKLDVAKLPIDILVRDDTTTQTLVELLAALQAIDVKPSAVVAGPSTAEKRREQLAAARDGRAMTAPGVIPGALVTQGDLDKPTIQFTVRQHITRIRACYEAELASNPTLNGTVMTMFLIRSDGTVTSSSASGVHPKVSSCVAKVIETIQFPKPNDGGLVQVGYPFTFKPAS